jgi:ACS family glucarate transporter-like MFS transporter
MLLERFGWRMMFAMTGLGALIWLPCWLIAVPLDGRRSEIESEIRYDGWGWRELIAKPGFWALSCSIFLASYYWYFVLTWVPSYLVLSKGFSNLDMGRLISTGLFTMAATNVAAGFAADRLAARMGVFRARLLFAATGYAGTAAILLLLAVPSRGWVLPVLTVSMCATGMGNSSFWAIVQHVSPKGGAGRSVGYLNTLSQVAGAVAPVITGWLLGPQKQFGPAILIAGVCPVVAALCLLGSGSRGLEQMKALLAGAPI